MRQQPMSTLSDPPSGARKKKLTINPPPVAERLLCRYLFDRGAYRTRTIRVDHGSSEMYRERLISS